MPFPPGWFDNAQRNEAYGMGLRGAQKIPGGLNTGSSPGSSWPNLSDAGQNVFEQEPFAAFLDYLNSWITSMDSPMARYSKDRFSDYHNAYLGSLANDPTKITSGYTFLQHLNDLPWQDTPMMGFFGADPQRRQQFGSQRESTGAPRMRWLLPGG